MIWRSAPIARGWSKRICHHQFVASRPPFHALPGSAENRSPLMAPSAVKPPKTVDAETTGAGAVTASAQTRVPQAANRIKTPVHAELLFVRLMIWPSITEGSLPSERKFRLQFNEGASILALTLALIWGAPRTLSGQLWPPAKGVCDLGYHIALLFGGGRQCLPVEQKCGQPPSFFCLCRRTTVHGSWTTPPRIRSRRSVLKQVKPGQYCMDMGQKRKRTSGECRRFAREAVGQIPTFFIGKPDGAVNWDGFER